MRALDTNVLLRTILRDDDAQHAAAAAFVIAAVERGELLFVADAVLCELVWVLQRTYRLNRGAVVGALRGLTGSPHLVLDEPEVVQRALAAYAAGGGDFADYLIRERGRAAGYAPVVTFDRALHAEPGFVAPA